METMNNYNGVILIVDLESKETETEDLSEELIEKALGGAAINMELYEQYKDRDPVILGSGFFTATFMPGACAGVMTAKSPLTGSVAHVPFGWQTGVELKLTGFDFVVILGKSDSLVRLWLHDGLADVDAADDIKGMDTWQTTDKIREAYGDEMIQMLCIGPAGENKSPVAQVSENYWGSKDCFNLGAVLGEKNLKAVAMRGLGALEVAEGFFQKCMEVKNNIITGTVSGKAGIADIAGDLGIDVADIKKSIHRNNAGYNCPYPYYTFLKYREAPDAMAMDGNPEPGCLVSDLAGYAQLQKAGLNAAEAIEKCYRLGLDPAASAAAGVSDISALDGLAEAGAQASDVSQRWPMENSPEAGIAAITRSFSTAVPPRGVFADQSQGPQWWVDRQALAYTIGLDPVIALMTPEINEDTVAELVQMCAEWDEFSVDDLKRITAELIQKSS